MKGRGVLEESGSQTSKLLNLSMVVENSPVYSGSFSRGQVAVDELTGNFSAIVPLGLSSLACD
jgi:hypothetical protein